MMEFACLLLTSATAPVAMAQDKVIKKAPMGQSDPSSGKAMYTSYCAPCHGASGKGDGPVASEFKVAPANLTQFTRKTKVSFLPAISGPCCNLARPLRRMARAMCRDGQLVRFAGSA